MSFNLKNNLFRPKKKRYYKGYGSTEPVYRTLQDVLKVVTKKIENIQRDKPGLILAAWPKIVGEQKASMTRALSFVSGVVTISVNNSTLHSILYQNERSFLLEEFKRLFPNVLFRDIQFRLG